tara:strand:+ start:80 stop:931 length:852 start_codon:yes stop_codon:yes gene_type:complete
LKSKNKIKKSLKKHLTNFGLKFFNNFDQYALWKENYFEKSNISTGTKKKYLRFLEKNLRNKSYSLSDDFYDLIAKQKKLMLITHSMKSNEILNSGLSVIDELKENSNILDIGCNSGYLTSFYAKVFPNCNFIGFDKSRNAILQAFKIFNFEQYNNLVLSCDYNIFKKYRFNFITDTQCFCTLNKKDLFNILELLKKSFHSNIKIISISNLRNEKNADIFLKLFLKKGLFVESISPLFVDTLNGIVAYTKIIFTQKNNNYNYDLNLYFKNVRKKISIVNLFNLN